MSEVNQFLSSVFTGLTHDLGATATQPWAEPRNRPDGGDALPMPAFLELLARCSVSTPASYPGEPRAMDLMLAAREPLGAF